MQTLQEAGLQLRHEGLEAQARLVDQTAQRCQDGCLDLPRKPVSNDPDQRPCRVAGPPQFRSEGRCKGQSSRCCSALLNAEQHEGEAVQYAVHQGAGVGSTHVWHHWWAAAPVIWTTKGFRAASLVTLTSSPRPSAASSRSSAELPCSERAAFTPLHTKFCGETNCFRS